MHPHSFSRTSLPPASDIYKASAPGQGCAGCRRTRADDSQAELRPVRGGHRHHDFMRGSAPRAAAKLLRGPLWGVTNGRELCFRLREQYRKRPGGENKLSALGEGQGTECRRQKGGWRGSQGLYHKGP